MPQPAIHERFDALASSDLAKFREFFRRMKELFPQQAAEACLLYIAAHGLDAAAQSMAYWLSADTTYIQVLLDPEDLPIDTASRAVAVIKDIDSEFFRRFAKAVASIESPPTIVRALGLLPAMGDYSILIPWLRSLGQSSDERVRARSIKMLCELRPSNALIQRQLLSNDPRVRADALEALWQSPIPEAASLLRSALTDTHQRVVGNALVGLYRLGDPDALNEMIMQGKHKNHLFRAAAAWAMGFVKDRRALPALRDLTLDPSNLVRKRALTSLLDIEAAQTSGEETVLSGSEVNRS